MPDWVASSPASAAAIAASADSTVACDEIVEQQQAGNLAQPIASVVDDRQQISEQPLAVAFQQRSRGVGMVAMIALDTDDQVDLLSYCQTLPAK